MIVAVNCCTDRLYDAYGRRVRSRRPVGGQQRIVKHHLLPDGRPYLDKPSALMQPAPVPWSYAYLGDRLLARFDNKGNVQHVVTDHIGYPMATISYTGTVQWQPDPEPFGDVISEQPAGSSKHDPLIRYPGQWRLDPVLTTTEPAFTTLYYNTHRWYNPTWGRYTQSDPVGEVPNGSGGLARHLYVYCRSNPLTFIDPLGLEECCLCPGNEWRLTGTFSGWVVAGWPGGAYGSFKTNGGILECLSKDLKFEVSAKCTVRDAVRPSLAFGIEIGLDPGIPITACNLDDLNRDVFLSGAGFYVPFMGRRFPPGLFTEGWGFARGFFSVNLACTINTGSYPANHH